MHREVLCIHEFAGSFTVREADLLQRLVFDLPQYKRQQRLYFMLKFEKPIGAMEYFDEIEGLRKELYQFCSNWWINNVEPLIEKEDKVGSMIQQFIRQGVK